MRHKAGERWRSKNLPVFRFAAFFSEVVSKTVNLVVICFCIKFIYFTEA